MKAAEARRLMQALEALSSSSPGILELVDRIEESSRQLLSANSLEIPEDNSPPEIAGAFQALQHCKVIRGCLRKQPERRPWPKRAARLSGEQVDSVLAHVGGVRRRDAEVGMLEALRLGQLAMRMRFRKVAITGFKIRSAAKRRQENLEAETYPSLCREWEAWPTGSMLEFWQDNLVQKHYKITYERLRQILRKYSSKKSATKNRL
jgi:hypothetical protein